MERVVVYHPHKVTKPDRSRIKGHKPCVVWLTGLPSSGKSTIANELEFTLNRRFKAHTYLLDGDNIRHGLNRDLGFSREDRAENIRRIGEVAKLFVDAGLIVITAFISPYRRDRAFARSLVDTGEFVEVYVKCPVEVCEKRDPKGLYQMARSGKIKGFTGVDDPYEEPENPEVVVETHKVGVEECVKKIVDYLEKAGILRACGGQYD